MENLLQEMIDSIRAEALMNNHDSNCKCYKCGWATRAEMSLRREKLINSLIENYKKNVPPRKLPYLPVNEAEEIIRGSLN